MRSPRLRSCARCYPLPPQVEELRSELEDVREVYRIQVDSLMLAAVGDGAGAAAPAAGVRSGGGGTKATAASSATTASTGGAAEGAVAAVAPPAPGPALPRRCQREYSPARPRVRVAGPLAIKQNEFET